MPTSPEHDDTAGNAHPNKFPPPDGIIPPPEVAKILKTLHKHAVTVLDAERFQVKASPEISAEDLETLNAFARKTSNKFDQTIVAVYGCGSCPEKCHGGSHGG